MAKYTIELPDKQKILPLLLFLSLLSNLIFIVVLAPPLFSQFKSAKSLKPATAATGDNIFDQINPAAGIEINAKYGDLGPKMISLGVIDANKFEETYASSNQPLTEEEKKILTQGSNEKIKITRDNSYFLLNFFWAVGLVNKSKILDEGAMVNSGGGRKEAATFASTGGWTLSKTSPMDYYSNSLLIPLTSDQEEMVNKVASNIYRPCCDNPTNFPDCNHGMALLGVLELMASQGASENDLYNAAKYFNAFWFPGNYTDIAQYFQAKEGKSFKDADAKTVLGKDYSSASGYQSVKTWLTSSGTQEQPPQKGSGNGCGV